MPLCGDVYKRDLDMATANQYVEVADGLPTVEVRVGQARATFFCSPVGAFCYFVGFFRSRRGMYGCSYWSRSAAYGRNREMQPRIHPPARNDSPNQMHRR